MKSLKKIVRKINEEFSQYPIIKYLKYIQPSWTKIFAIKMIRKKVVLVNNKKTTINYKLQLGDKVQILGVLDNLREKEMNLTKLPPMRVIYEDENVIVVNKEVGIDVQGNSKEHLYRNMNNRLLNHLNWSWKDGGGNKWKPVFIHRLDYNTEGLLIGAKNYQSYRELEKALKTRKIQKYYRVIVSGLVLFKELTIKNFLLKKDNKVYVVDKNVPNSKEAISEVKLIKHDFKEKNSILEVKIITGRTHQIRAQLAELGYPVRGDQKYGVEKEKKKYKHQKLIAYKLVFDEDIEGSFIENLKGKTLEIKLDI